jgi:hypothetical protein
MHCQVAVRRWNPDFTETVFDAEGNVVDEKTKASVDAYVAALGRWVRRFKVGKAAVEGTV